MLPRLLNHQVRQIDSRLLPLLRQHLLHSIAGILALREVMDLDVEIRMSILQPSEATKRDRPGIYEDYVVTDIFERDAHEPRAPFDAAESP